MAWGRCVRCASRSWGRWSRPRLAPIAAEWGERIENPCQACRGRGRAHDTLSYSVKIQPGISSEQVLQLAGKGAVGERGGTPGNLYIHIAVRPHERLRRDGDDLLDELSVPMTVARAGQSNPIRNAGRRRKAGDQTGHAERPCDSHSEQRRAETTRAGGFAGDDKCGCASEFDQRTSAPARAAGGNARRRLGFARCVYLPEAEGAGPEIRA